MNLTKKKSEFIVYTVSIHFAKGNFYENNNKAAKNGSGKDYISGK